MANKDRACLFALARAEPLPQPGVTNVLPYISINGSLKARRRWCAGHKGASAENRHPQRTARSSFFTRDKERQNIEGHKNQARRPRLDGQRVVHGELSRLPWVLSRIEGYPRMGAPDQLGRGAAEAEAEAEV